MVGTVPWTNPPSQDTSTTYDARNQRLQLVDGVTNATAVYDPLHNYQPAAVAHSSPIVTTETARRSGRASTRSGRPDS